MAEFNFELPVGTTRSFSNFVGNSDPEDTFRFGINVPTNFNTSLRGMTQDADLFLYRDSNNNGIIDVADQLIQSSSNGGNGDDYINRRLQAPLLTGNYIVSVRRFGTSNTNYRLDLSNTGNLPSNLLPVEENLGAIGISPIVRSNSVGTNDTADVFRFSTNQTGRFNASLTGITAGTDVDLRLIRDANNNGRVDPTDLIVSSTRGGNADEAINVRSLPAGVYFLQSYLYSGNSANYTLQASSTGSDPSNLLPVEDDITVGGTRNGSLNGTTSPSADADDIFRLSVSSTRRVRISLTNIVGADTDLRLIRENFPGDRNVDLGEELGRSTNSGTASEFITQTLTPGNYYIQTWLYPSSGSSSYTLGVVPV